MSNVTEILILGFLTEKQLILINKWFINNHEIEYPNNTIEKINLHQSGGNKSIGCSIYAGALNYFFNIDGFIEYLKSLMENFLPVDLLIKTENDDNFNIYKIN